MILCTILYLILVFLCKWCCKADSVFTQNIWKKTSMKIKVGFSYNQPGVRGKRLSIFTQQPKANILKSSCSQKCERSMRRNKEKSILVIINPWTEEYHAYPITLSSKPFITLATYSFFYFQHLRRSPHSQKIRAYFHTYY